MNKDASTTATDTRHVSSTPTPEITLSDKMPSEAWMIIERPTGETYIVGGSEGSAERALAHWSAA